MTLRRYGRALAAVSGAALMCASLSVPALATPESDTQPGDAATASASEATPAPITVTATRSDKLGGQGLRRGYPHVYLHLHEPD